LIQGNDPGEKIELEELSIRLEVTSEEGSKCVNRRRRGSGPSKIKKEKRQRGGDVSLPSEVCSTQSLPRKTIKLGTLTISGVEVDVTQSKKKIKEIPA